MFGFKRKKQIIAGEDQAEYYLPSMQSKGEVTSCGDSVKVLLCEDNCQYQGIFLGVFQAGFGMKQLMSPGIYVPVLKRVIFGYECYWCNSENSI